MATTQDYIEAAVTAIAGGSGGAPTGSLAAFAGTTIPSGWLLCNGANVSRTTYAKLFAAIGTKWGAGDGSTTFTLPNCDGRFLEGTTSTSNVGTYVSAGLPNITGNIPGGGAAYWSGCAYYISNSTAVYQTGGYTFKNIGFSAARSSAVYGSNTTVQPSSAYVLIIIKV